ncbi:MAG: sensor histidine kinase [Candidatus Glassbacteria bacterium]|nr:sensor histidine kinase [Candidatus Glassbacteria bacterium]
MTKNYLATYGTISQAAGEAVDLVMGLKAKVKGKCFGPSRELQDDVRRLYESEVLERLQLIGRLIVELGKMRPRRFATGLSRLSLNLGDSAESMIEVLYIPGYREIQKVAVSLLDHIQRSLVYFRKTIARKQDPTMFNVNYLFRDIQLAACPWREGLLPPGDERLVRVKFNDKLDENLPHMVGEADGIYLALYQIVCNALTAAGDSGTVSLYSRYFERFRQLQVTVADNGRGVDRQGVLSSAMSVEAVDPGIADEIRRDDSDYNNRVFELMCRPRVSTFADRNSAHKGIGLTLASEEVKRQGGRMEIYSKPGRGTTVQLFFTIK